MPSSAALRSPRMMDISSKLALRIGDQIKSERQARYRQIGDGVGVQRIDLVWPSDIFHALLTHILERISGHRQVGREQAW